MMKNHESPSPQLENALRALQGSEKCKLGSQRSDTWTRLRRGERDSLLLLLSHEKQFRAAATAKGMEAVALKNPESAASLLDKNQACGDESWLSLYGENVAADCESVSIGCLNAPELALLLELPGVKGVVWGGERHRWGFEIGNAGQFWKRVEGDKLLHGLEISQLQEETVSKKAFLFRFKYFNRERASGNLNARELARVLALPGWTCVFWDAAVKIPEDDLQIE